jgi:hypothetical protein
MAFWCPTNYEIHCSPAMRDVQNKTKKFSYISESILKTGLQIREAIKKRLSFGHCPKRGGGGVQPESKSFEVVLFSPILNFFWTINGGKEGGLTRFQKF